MDKQKKPTKIEEVVEIPNGISVSMTNGELKAMGPKGEVTKSFINPLIKVDIKDNKIVISGLRDTKREKKIVKSFKSHIKNMIRGCNQPYIYILKICSGHFPMNVSSTKDALVVKNFFGEKIPRKLKIRKGVNVKVDGDLISVDGVDKDLSSQVAADIEKLTQRKSYDRRIFQDGIYIIKKDEKEMK